MCVCVFMFAGVSSWGSTKSNSIFIIEFQKNTNTKPYSCDGGGVISKQKSSLGRKLKM